jgi:Ca-activated chloride channel homolog
MKYLIFVVLLFTSITDPVTRIAKSNALKKEAKNFYNQKEYEKAITAYGQLLDSIGTADDNAQLNMANAAYFLAYGDEALGLLKEAKKNPQGLDSSAIGGASESLKYAGIASNNYDALTRNSADKAIVSSAFNQKGIINYKQSEIAEAKDKEAFTNQALSDFKNAIKQNPTNESARYNYELLKKLIKQQEEQQKDDQNQDQNKDQKDQEKQDKKDQEKKDQEKQDQEKKDQEKQDQEKQENKDEQNKDQEKENPDEQDPNQENKPDEQDPLEKLKEKLKEMNISPEKAQMILEALKNNEIQYVQQNKRKATKKKDSSKPDW